MITNLLCTFMVTLVTNTSDRFPTHLVPAPCPDNILGCCVMHWKTVPVENPTMKWTRTTVKRVTTLEFQFQGKPMAATTEEPVSETELAYQLEKIETWKLTGTNNFATGNWITNGILTVTNWTGTNFYGTNTFTNHLFILTNEAWMK